MALQKTLVGVVLLISNLAIVMALPWMGLNSFTGNRVPQEKEIDVPFLGEANESEMLVFWGYVGCGTVCPVTMATLQQVYVSYQAEYPNKPLAVVFIGLPLPGELPRPNSADYYAKIFHQDFRGYSMAGAELSQAVSAFGVSFSPSVADPKLLNHTTFVYLLQRQDDQWKLKRTYRNTPLQPDTILADLRSLIH